MTKARTSSLNSMRHGVDIARYKCLSPSYPAIFSGLRTKIQGTRC
ncbi:hypothetical protein ANCCAN_05159 [Ancylostoma caninum]|uniref:Uncharacterized protein n=1 Tax=Ancylostoma caninum TaxID=29170 RepID=A0A368H098_ANCCA|nr:hypothetical protein ANCCAN_05159 [Ancylostoma caninum]